MTLLEAVDVRKFYGTFCALDGVSLTIASLDAGRFGVALIPHTLEVTTLGSLRDGDRLNVEVDLLGKYVHRSLQLRGLA